MFDLDGVLVDSTPAHAEAYRRLWRRLGVDGPSYAEIAGRPTREAVRAHTAALRPDERQLREWVVWKQAEALGLLEDRARVFDDTLPALRALRERGVAMALGTAASRGSVELLTRRHGLDRFLGAVVTGDDVSAGKPDPEVFVRAMELSGFGPERSLIVEDSVSGLRAAVAAGARLACVRTGLDVDHERFVGSFDDLAGLLAALGVPPR